MNLSDAEAWVVLISAAITAMTTMIVTLFNAFRMMRVEGKVDTVHELTNSRLARIEGELLATRQELQASLLLNLQHNDRQRADARETPPVAAVPRIVEP